jgi:hypothetical protein
MSRVLPLACLCLLGCESVADVVAQHRPGVEKTFAAVQALAPRVALTGPVFTSQVKAAPVVLEGGASANAMFIYAEDLSKPGAARSVPLRSLDSVPLLQCGSLLSNGTYFADAVTRPAPSVVGQYLSACERLEYVLVIRKIEFTPPLLSLETKKFASGVYRAEVLVFELRSGTLLGGYLVEATNEASVMLLDGDADHTKRLLSNLESTVFSALREATRKAIPGSLPPAK